MLKGLKGILEKGLQIAAPLIGNAILPGGLGAAAGSGIASLLGGAKPQEALLQAGVAGILGKQFAPASTSTATGADIRAGNEMLNFNRGAPKENIFSKIGSSLMKDG